MPRGVMILAKVSTVALTRRACIGGRGRNRVWSPTRFLDLSCRRSGRGAGAGRGEVSGFRSAHEGIAIIEEEMAELVAEVRRKRCDTGALRGEAVQVAAMGRKVHPRPAARRARRAETARARREGDGRRRPRPGDPAASMGDLRSAPDRGDRGARRPLIRPKPAATGDRTVGRRVFQRASVDGRIATDRERDAGDLTQQQRSRSQWRAAAGPPTIGKDAGLGWRDR